MCATKSPVFSSVPGLQAGSAGLSLPAGEVIEGAEAARSVQSSLKLVLAIEAIGTNSLGGAFPSVEVAIHTQHE